MGVIKRIACTALSAMMMLSFGAIGVNAEALSSSSDDSLSLACGRSRWICDLSHRR